MLRTEKFCRYYRKTPCTRPRSLASRSSATSSSVSVLALLDHDRMNVGVTVFVTVRTSRHSRDWLEAFRRAVTTIPEIVEAHRLSGDVDYLLRAVVPSIDGWDAVYRRLIEAVEFSDVSSSFSMEQLKFTTAIPVDHV